MVWDFWREVRVRHGGPGWFPGIIDKASESILAPIFHDFMVSIDPTPARPLGAWTPNVISTATVYRVVSTETCWML